LGVVSNLSSSEQTGGIAFDRWAVQGFEYPERLISHGRAWQDERLTASDVAPSRYGDVAEIGLFGLDCFVSMVDAGLDIDGYIFVDQQFILERTPKLGEALTLSGKLLATTQVSRGLFVDEVYRFHDADGALCIETRLRGIVALPADALDPTRTRPMPPRSVQPADAWKLIESKQLTPAKVKQFSEDVGNDIHFDPNAALRHGFRAPLAQGVMSAVYLIGALARERIPKRFDILIDYLRPVFWDAEVTLWSWDGRAEGEPLMIQSRNDEGKVTAHLTVRSLSYE